MAKHVVALSPSSCQPTAETRMDSKAVWGELGCFTALQRSDGFADLFELRTGEAWVRHHQLGWCQESFGDGGEIFFFWLAHPRLEGGLLGDPCREGASLLHLCYWPSYSDWAAAELVSWGWELRDRRCTLSVVSWKENTVIVSLKGFKILDIQNGFRKDLLFWAEVSSCVSCLSLQCAVTLRSATPVRKKPSDQKNCLRRSN